MARPRRVRAAAAARRWAFELERSTLQAVEPALDPGPVIVVPREILDLILRAGARAPVELCGLLRLAPVPPPGLGRVVAARWMRNHAARPSHSFRMRRDGIDRVLDQWRADDPTAALGYFHTHGRLPPTPSRHDLEVIAELGSVHLIAGGGRVRAYFGEGGEARRGRLRVLETLA